MANVLDCGPKGSEFEIQSLDDIHFWTNTLEKGMNPYILLAVK